ncbi:hypothetical protein [Pseudoalteromonas luteoviolacea]|uniref:hypothetical protein n=1 Tax=Pseudoalteromonas luteoviolacea TaxID=43657 RepID=UPI001146CFB8|nr:hypothetical protein [Pseudoalteromonas luteoviolacea]
MLNIKLDTSDALVQLEALSLPEKKRRAILRDMGRKSRNLSVDRVKEGKNRDGRKWEDPKNGKIFKKINQKKRTYIKTSGMTSVIGYKKGRWGAIANAHAKGLKDKFTVKNLKNRNLPDDRSRATQAQAERLVDLGYKRWDKRNKAFKEVSEKTIRRKLKFGQAGLIIRLLKERNKAAEKQRKKEWDIKRPVRELLGNTVSEQNKIRIAELERKMFLQQKS